MSSAAVSFKHGEHRQSADTDQSGDLNTHEDVAKHKQSQTERINKRRWGRRRTVVCALSGKNMTLKWPVTIKWLTTTGSLFLTSNDTVSGST